jgi:tellurite resistance protein TerC
MSETVLWVGFNVFILVMLVLDLGVFNRKSHEIKVKEALLWSLFWITLSMIFNLGIYYFRGTDVALEFFTGYIIEKSLSVDNIFVFLMIFTYFKVSPKYQHKVLFYGILGALVFRAIFIFAGIALIQNFHWIIYVFGAFLVFNGINMITGQDKEIHPAKNPVIRAFRKLFPVTKEYHGSHFFVKVNKKLHATPLFIVVLMVETTDIIFAVDSIPAILAISHDPFIVYTSNVMAILGLRALYFALSAVMRLFHYIQYGLSVILVFVGVKMIIGGFDIKLPISVTLLVIGAILVLSIVASIVFPKKSTEDKL